MIIEPNQTLEKFLAEREQQYLQHSNSVASDKYIKVSYNGNNNTWNGRVQVSNNLARREICLVSPFTVVKQKDWGKVVLIEALPY